MRKLREVILAWRIEQRFSKDDILRMYLNQIFYGHNAYGVEAASQIYFGKSAKDLTLGEATLIVGLTQAPQYVFAAEQFGVEHESPGACVAPDGGSRVSDARTST